VTDAWLAQSQRPLGITNSERINMSRLAIVREFWDFIKVRKKWWLAPIVILLLLLSALIILAEGSALAPFIYAIF